MLIHHSPESRRHVNQMINTHTKLFPGFNKEKCMACTICVEVCPAGALDLAIANSITGFRLFPVLANQDQCMGCCFCEKHCPTGAIIMAS